MDQNRKINQPLPLWVPLGSLAVLVAIVTVVDSLATQKVKEFHGPFPVFSASTHSIIPPYHTDEELFGYFSHSSSSQASLRIESSVFGDLYLSSDDFLDRDLKFRIDLSGVSEDSVVVDKCDGFRFLAKPDGFYVDTEILMNYESGDASMCAGFALDSLLQHPHQLRKSSDIIAKQWMEAFQVGVDAKG